MAMRSLSRKKSFMFDEMIYLFQFLPRECPVNMNICIQIGKTSGKNKLVSCNEEHYAFLYSKNMAHFEKKPFPLYISFLCSILLYIRKCNLRARNNKRRSIDKLNPTNVLTPSKLQQGHLICNRITLKTSTWALLLLSRLLSGPH